MSEAARSSQRRYWLVVFGLLSLLVLAQNLGTPRNASPDEPAHMVRSAGIVRGELYGDKTDSVANRAMDVPWWADEPRPDCYAMRPYVPATCSVVIRDDPSTQLTAAGGYPPLAHLIAGVGTLAPFDARNQWLSRQLLGEACAALLASAIVLCRRRPLAAASVWLASTPMVTFLIGTVNPSGLFACGAIAAWTGLLWAGEEEDGGGPDESTAAGWLAVAGAASMLLSRPDGLIFVALIVALVACVCGPRRLLAVLRGMRPAQGIIVAGSAVISGIWTVVFRTELLPVSDGLSRSTSSWLTEIVSRSGEHLGEAIGVLGWLDTDIPMSATMLWLLAAGAIVGTAVLRHRGPMWPLWLTVAATITVPWILELAQAHRAGLFWQGRYSLPLFVGVVSIAGWMAARPTGAAPSVAEDRRFGVARFVVIAHGIVLVAAYAQMLRRFGVGAAGSLLPWNWDGPHIPLPATLLLVVQVLAVAGVCVVVLTGAPRRGAASLADRV